jgi:hypothetical protein
VTVVRPPARKARTTSSVWTNGSVLPLPVNETACPLRLTRTSGWRPGTVRVGKRRATPACVAFCASGKPIALIGRPDGPASGCDTVMSTITRVG